MTNNKKSLLIDSAAVLFFAVMDAILFIVNLVKGFDFDSSKYDLGDLASIGLTAKMLESIVIGVIIAIAVISILLYLLVGTFGLMASLKGYTGKAHSVLSVILSITTAIGAITSFTSGNISDGCLSLALAFFLVSIVVMGKKVRLENLDARQ